MGSGTETVNYSHTEIAEAIKETMDLPIGVDVNLFLVRKSELHDEIRMSSSPDDVGMKLLPLVIAGYRNNWADGSSDTYSKDELQEGHSLLIKTLADPNVLRKIADLSDGVLNDILDNIQSQDNLGRSRIITTITMALSLLVEKDGVTENNKNHVDTLLDKILTDISRCNQMSSIDVGTLQNNSTTLSLIANIWKRRALASETK